jgi:hypothetical protein
MTTETMKITADDAAKAWGISKSGARARLVKANYEQRVGCTQHYNSFWTVGAVNGYRTFRTTLFVVPVDLFAKPEQQ